MFDQPLFLRTLSRFAAALPSEYDVAGVPMRLENRVVGALNLYGDEPRDWDQEDLDHNTGLRAGGPVGRGGRPEDVTERQRRGR